MLGSEVNLSTANHPQSDGQSEREIQTLITALRSYVNAMGDDWDESCLPSSCPSTARCRRQRVRLPSHWCMAPRRGCRSTACWNSAAGHDASGRAARRAHEAGAGPRTPQAELAQAKQKRLADRTGG